MAKAKKDLDTEVNLIAFISLLSVLICSLLLSVIWVQIGSLNIKQAIGGQAQEQGKKPPVVWAKMLKDGNIQLQLQDAPKVARSLRKILVKGEDGKTNFETLDLKVAALRKAIPKLNMALIQPRAKSEYEEVISLMDHFKKAGIEDLGVAPL